ncbi:hypothetical protein V6N12_057035 [Hibiscus sabdariffa]|uniref:Uncharacterized protein n=1 Tax=Hibiscus sabdariffa TaxID=183260 RepID=A0ABR2DCU1_9ROSI
MLTSAVNRVDSDRGVRPRSGFLGLQTWARGSRAHSLTGLGHNSSGLVCDDWLKTGLGPRLGLVQRATRPVQGRWRHGGRKSPMTAHEPHARLEMIGYHTGKDRK